MKENFIYPVVFHTGEGGQTDVSFPDFPEIMTCVEEGVDAISEVQELLAGVLLQYEAENKKAPEPSEENTIKVNEGDRLVYIHLWLPYYRNRTKEIYIKKSVTIPQWLDILAKENDISFSAALVRGVKEELGIQ